MQRGYWGGLFFVREFSNVYDKVQYKAIQLQIKFGNLSQVHKFVDKLATRHLRKQDLKSYGTYNHIDSKPKNFNQDF